MEKDKIWGTADSEAASGSPEWRLLEKIVLASVTEQRRARRWSIFFKLLFVSCFLLVISLMGKNGLQSRVGISKDHTGVIDVRGEIADSGDASAQNIIQGLRDASASVHCKAIILRINSPGGSPVQADLVYHEILRLRHLHPDRKIYAVITDVGASGAYYIASAAEDIYVNPASIVGSIGVIMESFGFPELLHKVGVERRVLTAGTHKAIGDPFSPQNADDLTYIHNMLEQVHEQFISAVRTGRGSRLHETPDIFSGLFWTGAQALKLGLADGFNSDAGVAREIVHAEDLVNYTHQDSPWDNAARKLGVYLLGGVMQSLSAQGVHLD